ncbi:ATP-dependent DNA helicase pcrA [Geobacillus proteiniphilus]|uniref:DNA 3'-5' helicase n=1 Tax=Geobacillus proteiniphilus TaxID=860353 RepID=A0A1Q5SVV5_9BACL|nr:UvrD-helicase domain-containing protein [Geobacillus proteiniphilus]OKO92082.1 ATP-dependent DNA helicase pcrA [Geobacillus proteiniphilus]
MERLERAPIYSYLEVIPSSEMQEDLKRRIKGFLLSGIKVLLLTDKDICFKGIMDEEEEKGFRESYLLQIFTPDSSSFHIKDHLTIVDGENITDELGNIVKHFRKFNFEQYLVEHAPANEHLSIKAGAGTGKTTVMVQRVMYLLQKAGVSPREIAMITFTRDAAQEMFHRLRKELFNRYRVTRQIRYLNYIEELKNMRISTIHSFAKMLLKEMGSILGYGRDVHIRTFRMERKRIIEMELERYLLKNDVSKTLEKLIAPLRLHELVDTLNSFWEEMEKKGMTIEEITSLDWGEATKDHVFYNDIMKAIFPAVEREFQRFKQENNTVSLNDLTRQVDLALKRQKTGKGNAFEKLPFPFRYIFVDEFQDSDDVQIRLIAQMQKALNSYLFVVGDIKQSIYRFRGADHTAFNRLQQEVKQNGQKIKQYNLRKNYRTAMELLDEMHLYFLEWGKNGWLQYSDTDPKDTDRLIGIRNMPKDLPYPKIIYKTVDKPKDCMEDDVVEMIIEAKRSLELDQESKSKEKRKIAVLVRTNKEAKLVEHWCKKKGIDTYLNVGGTFFNSEAVKHFSILVEALLYPKRVLSILNLLNTPYSSKGIDWTALAKFNGNEKEIYEFLREEMLSADDYESGFPLLKITKQLRIRPVFSVLRQIITATRPDSRYYWQERERIRLQTLTENQGINEENWIELVEEKAKFKWKQYVKNLNHLMDLLHEHFDSDFATLYGIHTWLKQNQATNRDEDEPRVDEIPEDIVQIMTVHRSKGLEFHTVLIPFTERPFRYNFSEILFDEDKKQAGWKIRKQNETRENLNYKKLSQEEELAVLQEETRLLYVAMTRVQNQLWIIKNNYSKNPSVWNWTKLLSKKLEV